MKHLKILQKFTKKGTLPLEFIVILTLTAILVVAFIIFIMNNAGHAGG